MYPPQTHLIEPSSGSNLLFDLERIKYLSTPVYYGTLESLGLLPPFSDSSVSRALQASDNQSAPDSSVPVTVNMSNDFNLGYNYYKCRVGGLSNQ
jgi:hypothetical protein